MNETTRFTIGSSVTCSDGACGKLTRVIVDPIARSLTHLVVDPNYSDEDGRLVPIALVESAADEIRLSCSSSGFDALEKAEETQFLDGASGEWDYGQEQMLSHPFYGGSVGGMGMGGVGMGGMDPMQPQTITRDRVPVGEVEVRRGDHVHASDGKIGRVQGLVVDPTDHHVTHVLLEEGHLWGKKTVGIPIGAVTSVADGVQVSLTKDEVGALPPVELDQPG
jgi:sporulation protein YlmC with PRC-barrel domain